MVGVDKRHLLMKRGYFYSIDALIAFLIIISVLIFFKPVPKQNIELKKVQEDVLDVLSNVNVGEIDNAYVKKLIEDGTIDNQDRTLLEQVGEFYVLGKKEHATNLTREIFNELKVTDNIGIWMNKEIVYSKNSTPIEASTTVWTAQELISGVKENIGNVTTGFSARPLILRNHLTEYFYFGGYVGDGNITANITYKGNIKGARIEAQINNDFSLYINGNFIGNYIVDSSQLTIIDLSPFLDKFQSRDNIVKINGNMPFFISGGFIAIDYETTNIFEPKKEYRFPGIEGIINLYDSFYLPETPTRIESMIHYKSDYVRYSICINV
ncbi:hypothetical protein HYV49_01485 [Candidatus Pacearchaeota archaeon]|nr:hypothetical protein [Candidatus Pacearchaeota archaeon]